jgi:serine/threonine protein kinase/Tol biopolymer transport system component
MDHEANSEISHYQIICKLGSGGMGEVYLAQDTKLERKVALKILPSKVAANRERMRRFVQEAKAAAALNHPNIAHIYEIGEADGVNFIAMEFIDGQTLREYIHRGETELGKLLRHMQHVAGGLAKAHAAGIVHRDLKPDNIMITRDNYAKILDFGLAKLMEPRQPSGDTRDASEVATAILEQHSTPGAILGTAGYMSPEQAQGRTNQIDHRADIFSFGCILFEGVTGHRAFEGKDSIDTLNKIIREPVPPLSDFRPDTPNHLQRIVRRCLAKDPEDRYQTIKDVAIELRELRRELAGTAEIETTVPPSTGGSPLGTAAVSSGTTQSAPSSSAEYIISEIKRHKAGAATALVAFLLVLGGAGYGVYELLERKGTAQPFQSFKITRLTNTGKTRDAIISPDGRYVVHVIDDGGQQGLWVRQVATASNVQIVAPAETAYLGLTFSRDGEYVYYVTRDRNTPIGKLYQIPVLGGTPRKLIEDVDSPVGFSPDQKQLAFIRNEGSTQSHLVVANADGSGEQKVATLKRPEAFLFNQARGPAWSPDGKVIAFGIVRTDASGTYNNIAVVSASGGSLKEVTSTRWNYVRRAAWLADGAGLLMVAAETPANGGAQQVYYVSYPGGSVRRVTNDLNNYYGMSLNADGSAFATVQGVTTANLWVAHAGDAAAARQITSGANKDDGILGVASAADGRIVYFSTAGGNPDLWIIKPDGSDQRQLTSSAGTNTFPAVSPDGRYIAFVSSRTGTYLLWRMDIDGASLKELGEAGPYPPAFSPDGRWVVYEGSVDYGLLKVSIDGGESVRLSQTPSQLPRVSPDGKLIACIYRETPGARYQLAILPSEGGQPVKTFDIARTFDWTRRLSWSPDGAAIHYVDTRGGVSNIWSQPAEGGPPKQLTNFKSDLIFAFDWSRDGKLLVLSRGTINSDVVLISDAK